MKIAYLLGSLNRGGTETLLLDVFRNAANADYQMIGIYRHGGAYLDDFRKSDVPFIECGVKQKRFISYLLQLRKILKNNQVSVAHAQQFIDCLYARFATIGTNIKIVETFHGYDFDSSFSSRLLIFLSMLLADRVCFVSKAEKQYYLKRYHLFDSKKYQVVYNGLDFSKFDYDFPEPDIFTKIDSAKPRIEELLPRLRMAMVGNFVSGRSQSIVCRAIDILAQRGVTDFDFYFVGRRNEKEPWRYDDCVNYCQDHGLEHVHFVGGRGDVPAILRHIDAFVYSSDHDTFGIAVVEALACGIPVFVNDLDVMCELYTCVGRGNTRSQYKSKSAESLADVLTDYLNNQQEYAESAKQDAVKIRNRFSIQSHTKRLHEIYKTLS
mgnify:CR=1 FL=1